MGRSKRRKTGGSLECGLRAQGAGPVKRTQRTPFDPHGSDEFTYTIREIKAEGQRFGKPAWLIGWEGFDDTADTWEPIENLAGHEQDIAAFYRKREEARLVELAANEARKKRKAPEENPQSSDNEQGQESGTCLGGKPWGKKESRVLAILQYFRLDPDNNDKILELVCKTCGEEDAVAYSGNTSNLRSHLSHVHKDLFCKLVSKEKEEGVSSDSSPNKHGMLQAMLPPVSEERRNELHKKNVLKLSVEGKDDVKAEITKLKAEGILPSIAGDIWEMELATKRASADIGIGVFVESEDGDIVEDTVVESIHATASDSASNIVKDWQVFDGHECSCHTLALSVKPTWRGRA
ncbi:La ribonucleoprotein [Cymbomonas tetramitiformis]|uniref:La ribonucleoprotein n=1 Tax=Cymbomonas tetramitiformis TaxID=36881 RepID=A0AAE0G6V2_9CHLO|nr:La ribonucleoprotein [Cymbomonas tetramitiformis]